MSTKKITIVLVAIATAIVGLQSCYKVATVVPKTDVEVTEPVSFAKDIMPIFDSKCNMSGCHSSGGIKPDLTSEKALSAIENGGYLNIDAPENSELFLWLTGKKAAAMPPGGPENPDNLNQLVLAWIKQGAQNN